MMKAASVLVQNTKEKIQNPYAKPLYELEKLPRTELRFS